MEIIFLGTSSGTPTKTRNVSGIVIKKSDTKAWCLVDCGEATQHQILKTKLALNHLDAIMITHVHGDHCFGLPGLLASAAMAGRTQPITIIAPAAIKQLIDTAQVISDTFLPYEIDFIAVESMNESITLSDFSVNVHELSHRVRSFAYGFTESGIERSLNAEKLKADDIPPGPVWGQIQAGKNITLDDGQEIQASDYWLPARKPRKVVVGGDNDTPELLTETISDTDLLIHEATYTELIAEKVGPGPQHSSAKKVAVFAQKNQLKNLILTHFSARYQSGEKQPSNISEIEQEARAHYQGKLFLANDFDHFVLGKAADVSPVD